jgi:hypothetical protein
MAGGRFDLRPIFRGHWRGLTDGRTRNDKPDWASRLVLLSAFCLLPVGYVLDWKLGAPGPLLAGVALLAGALIGSFGTMTTLRLKIAELGGPDDEGLEPERDLLDESVSHVLLAALVAATDAVALVIGTNTAATAPIVGVTKAAAAASTAPGTVTGFWASAAIALSAYLFLIFVMLLPRLYAAYVQLNNVRDGLNGQNRRRRRHLVAR